MQAEMSTRPGEQRSSKPSSFNMLRHRNESNKEKDLERGMIDDSSDQKRQIDVLRQNVKKRYENDFRSTKQDVDKLFDDDKKNDSIIEGKADRIVAWLEKDVLHISSDKLSEIHKKVKFALEQKPVTARLFEEGMRLQEGRDKQSQYSSTAVIVKERYFGSGLSSVKEKVATALSEERARYDHLLGKVKENGGKDTMFYKANEAEINKLEKKIEKSNIYKQKKTKVKIEAIASLNKYSELLDKQELDANQKALKLHEYKTALHNDTMRQIHALKAEYRSELQKDELTTAQGHTTHGVGLGNYLHMAEMLPGYASLALSALAESQTAKALNQTSKHN